MNSTDNWLIAVTAGKWQRHGIREAHAIGLKVLAIDSDPEAEGFLDAHKSLVMSFDDHERVLSSIRDLDLNIKGVVSFCSEAGMELAARIREAFGLPGPGIALTKRLLDKALQRKIWTEKGIPGPRWELCHNLDEGVEVVNRFGFPFIIKPTDSSGSRGVTKLESLDDDIHAALERAFQFSKNGHVLVEEFMDGTEFTAEIFAVNGTTEVLAVTEKKKVAGTRGTVAYELATPDRSVETLESIASTVSKSYAALGYTDGPGHAEVMLLNDGGVGLIEAAGRGGGFMVFDRFVPEVSGVNLARMTVLQAVGEEVGEIVKKEKACVLRFFPARSGVVKSVTGYDKANALEGVEAESFVKKGSRLGQAKNDGDRLGYILSCSDKPDSAQQLADKAESLIHYDIGELL